MHLTEKNIQEMAYAYVRKVRLSDRQVGFKRHMADCGRCYNQFLIEWELQEALLESGLISDAVMKEVLKGKKQPSERVLLRMKKAADGLRLFIEEVKDKTDSLWNFYPAPSVAFSRGNVEEDEPTVYESVLSEYSMIQVSKDGLLIRLDKSDYPAERFVLKIAKGNAEERIPFVYNWDEESYDAFVKGTIETGTQFEILEVTDED